MDVADFVDRSVYWNARFHFFQLLKNGGTIGAAELCNG